MITVLARILLGTMRNSVLPMYLVRSTTQPIKIWAKKNENMFTPRGSRTRSLQMAIEIDQNPIEVWRSTIELAGLIWSV